MDCGALIAAFENDPSSAIKYEDIKTPDYEKKRMENIAEKKDLFDEKLRRAKLACSLKPFKCSKCLSEFMKKAQLKSHQCFKCDLCNKYFKVTLNNQSFYKHDMDEHDGFFTKKSKSKRPLRERKNINRLVKNISKNVCFLGCTLVLFKYIHK